MRISVVIFVAGVLVSSCSEAQHSEDNQIKTTTENDQESPKTIAKVLSPEEFKGLIGKEGYQLLDVRTEPEYSGGHIENALNINFFDADFKEQLGQLDKTKPVLIYCASGNRSGKATLIMKEMGFTEIYDLRGGYGSWPY